MRTAVILVTFNGWEMTRNCLSDMAAQLTDSEHLPAQGIPDGSCLPERQESWIRSRQ